MEEDVQDQRLLLYAKEGNSALIQKLLQARMNQSSSLNINFRCKYCCYHLLLDWSMFLMVYALVAQSKSTPGWTALHLASSFGYREVVEELLQVCFFKEEFLSEDMRWMGGKMTEFCRQELMWICRKVWETHLYTRQPNLEERYQSILL